ncbi:zinc knuckle CX2CX4HX4C containing protein [Tanacetum coccineum]
MSYKITSLSLAFLCVSATCLDVPEELASRTSERAYYLEARHIRYLRMLRKKKSRLRDVSFYPYPCARCGLVVDTGEDGITSLLISFNATINNMEGGDSQKSELNKSVKEVNDRFANTYFGYFIGKRLAFPIIWNYVKNTWAKYGLDRVLENGPWLIRMVPIILNGWTPNNKPKTEEITSAPGRITYSRALIEVSSEQALLETLVVVIGHTMETIDIEYEWQPPQCETCKIFGHTVEQCSKIIQVASLNEVPDDGFVEEDTWTNKAKTGSSKGYLGSDTDDSDSEEVKNVFVEDNGKLMDGLVDNARKKVEALPKKTPRKIGIWSGRKVDSPKRNVAFSLETKIHYFDRDDIEEVKHENAYIKKG